MWTSQIVVTAGKVLTIGVICVAIIVAVEWHKNRDARPCIIDNAKVVLATIVAFATLAALFLWPWQTMGAGALIALVIAGGKEGWRDPLLWGVAVIIVAITVGNVLSQGHERSIPWKQCGTGRYSYDC